MSDTLFNLGSIWYHSEPSDDPYSPNQFLGWDFFCHFLQQDSSREALLRFEALLSNRIGLFGIYLNPILAACIWNQRGRIGCSCWYAYSKWNCSINRGSNSSCSSGNYGRAESVMILYHYGNTGWRVFKRGGIGKIFA